MAPDLQQQRRIAHVARTNAATRARFEEWLTTPEVQLMVSLIAPPADPDVARTALYAAFRAGWGGGMDFSLMSLCDALIGNPPPPSNEEAKGPQQ